MVIPGEDPNLTVVVFLGLETGAFREISHSLEGTDDLYQILFENSGIGMMFIGEDTTISLVNKAFEDFTGYSKAQVEGKKSWTELIADEDDLLRMKTYHRLRRVDRSLAPTVYDTRMRNRNGEVRDIMIRVEMIPGTTFSLASLVDMTEKNLAEEILRESEEKYRTLVENMQDTLYRTDLQGNLTFVSPSGARLLGFDSGNELVGKNVARDFYFIPEERDAFLRLLKQEGKIANFEVTLKRKDGNPVTVSTNSHFYFDKKGNLQGVEGIFTDISDRKRLEEERRKLEQQLSQSQKMDAIGQLAGGVAHDINNILMGIQGTASLLLLDCGPQHPHFQKLSQIENHVKRGANLTRQLLGFAREGKYEVKTISLNDLIQKNTSFFLETRREIEADLQLQKDLFPVDVDSGQIEQVLLNLFINASHAMPKGGRLNIQTCNLYVNEEEARRFEIKPGNYVKVSVTDSGTGMDQATLSRIFEPFFTTKGQTGGTGLGLASAYGIIRNHGGAINAYSELGHGSTFNIFLPSSAHSLAPEPQAPKTAPLPGQGGILLVDDEPMILKTTAEMLGTLGYTVFSASNGPEAVGIFLKHRNEIHLVILDMILPGMSGSEVLKKLKDMNPEVSVLLSSGYGLQGDVQALLEKGCCGFIQKPYNFTELSHIIYKILFPS